MRNAYGSCILEQDCELSPKSVLGLPSTILTHQHLKAPGKLYTAKEILWQQITLSTLHEETEEKDPNQPPRSQPALQRTSSHPAPDSLQCNSTV